MNRYSMLAELWKPRDCTKVLFIGESPQLPKPRDRFRYFYEPTDEGRSLGSSFAELFRISTRSSGWKPKMLASFRDAARGSTASGRVFRIAGTSSRSWKAVR